MAFHFVSNLKSALSESKPSDEQRETVYTPASTSTFLLVPVLLLFVLMVVAVVRSPNLLSNEGIGSAIIVATPLILATFALTSVVMAGRAGVDLSIGPLIGFINVTLVQLYAGGYLESGFSFFIYAIAVGVAYQLLVGCIIYFVRIQPIIVALSGFLVMAGLNLIILPRPGGSAPEWMLPWGLGTSIWSPVLAVLAVALAGWFLFTRTAFYDHLRLMGSDERTAYSAGVDIVIVRLGAHVIAGIFAALAALTFTSLISSGDPTQGTTYTLMAVTALVLGGTSLAGGRGSIIGSLLGALNIYLITYVLATFNFGKVQSFVTQLSYGVVLVVALLLTLFLPTIQRYTRGLSPLAVFIVLGLGVAGVTLHVQDDLVAQTSVGSGLGSATSLAGQSLASGTGGTSLAAQSGGTSLAAQSGGSSLAAQTGGSSLAGQSLGQSLSGTTEQVEEVAPTGTPVVIAAVIIAVLISLIYLLYRFKNVASFLLFGVVALLVIGYAAYDPALTQAVGAAVGDSRIAVPSLFYLEGPALSVAASGKALVATPLASTAIILLGAILVGSVLIFSTVTYQRQSIGAIGLGAIVVAAIVLIGLLTYEDGLFAHASDTFFHEALAALIIGAILFTVTLPTFQTRVKNITALMLFLIGTSALGAMFFATSTVMEPVVETEAIIVTAEPVMRDGLQTAVFPVEFHVASWSVLILGVVVFLLAIPGVRRHILWNVAFDKSIRRFSYLGFFIASFSILALGAIFYIGDVPIWKFAVALVAAIIFSRVIWHFLGDFRARRSTRSEGQP